MDAYENENEPLDPNATLLKDAAIEIRLGFIRKVYGILSAQLLLTVAIAAPISTRGPVWAKGHQWLLIVSSFVMLATMCSMCCCQRHLRRFPTNYVFLLILTGAMSVIVGFTSAMYTPESVLLAAGITVGIFLSMTLYAWKTTTDFTGMGPYLMGAFFCIMMFGFALSIMSFCGVHIPWLVMLYDFFGVLLFTFYIVYDTQLILGSYGGHRQSFSIDDYAFAALQLYLDVINLFLHLLRLFGKRR
eukprot:TRINITY_DN22934_c0_g1_i1.p1 TRINITY_DN22934_c0_g1~~TRINITY_DN22934_c0_g1_i1.p1  ORF type:complete len:245 (+),score=26.99 TRINITY_DN22934_c0_g1_i1:100-834(+)